MEAAYRNFLALFLLLIIFKNEWHQVDCFPSNVGDEPTSLRIVGGNEPDSDRKLPYQVAVLYHGNFVCGGSLLKGRVLLHVLTAAQCVHGREANGFSVRVGSVNHDKGGHVTTVAKVLKHHNFKPESLENDIAILKLKNEFSITLRHRPVTLPAATSGLDNGKLCIASGWGATIQGGHKPVRNLRFTEVPVITRSSCQDAYLSDKRSVTELNMCTGLGSVEEAGKGPCDGDTGGPLITAESLESKKLESKKYLQYGIYSFGGCGLEGQPAVYTRVSKYIQWINDQMKETF